MRKIKGVKLQFIPFSQLAGLTSYKRIKFLLNQVSENKILVLQGRLKPEEEADLIEETMKKIRKGRRFKGVEIATLNPQTEQSLVLKIRKKIADALIGDRDVLTLIGPATIVKEIKKDLRKLELFLKFK